MNAVRQTVEPRAPRATPSRLALEALYSRQRVPTDEEELSEADVDGILSRAAPSVATPPGAGEELDAARGLVWGLVWSLALWGGVAAVVVALR